MGFIPHATLKRFMLICVTTSATSKTIAVYTSRDNPSQTRSLDIIMTGIMIRHAQRLGEVDYIRMLRSSPKTALQTTSLI